MLSSVELKKSLTSHPRKEILAGKPPCLWRSEVSLLTNKKYMTHSVFKDIITLLNWPLEHVPACCQLYSKNHCLTCKKWEYECQEASSGDRKSSSKRVLLWMSPENCFLLLISAEHYKAVDLYWRMSGTFCVGIRMLLDLSCKQLFFVYSCGTLHSAHGASSVIPVYHNIGPFVFRVIYSRFCN